MNLIRNVIMVTGQMKANHVSRSPELSHSSLNALILNSQSKIQTIILPIKYHNIGIIIIKNNIQSFFLKFEHSLHNMDLIQSDFHLMNHILY